MPQTKHANLLVFVESAEVIALANFLKLNCIGSWQQGVSIRGISTSLSSWPTQLIEAMEQHRHIVFYHQAKSTSIAASRIVPNACATNTTVVHGIKKGRETVLSLLRDDLVIQRKFSNGATILEFVDGCDESDTSLAAVIQLRHLTPQVAAFWHDKIQPRIRSLAHKRADHDWDWTAYQRAKSFPIASPGAAMFPTLPSGGSQWVTGGKRLACSVHAKSHEHDFPIGMIAVVHHCHPIHQSESEAAVNPLYVSRLTAVYGGHTDLRPTFMCTKSPTVYVLEAIRRLTLLLQHGELALTESLIPNCVPHIVLTADPAGGEDLTKFYRDCGLEQVLEQDVVMPATLRLADNLRGTVATRFRNSSNEWHPIEALRKNKPDVIATAD